MAVEAGSQPPSSDATVSRRRARPSVTSLIGLGLLFLVGVWLVGNLVKDPSDFFTVFIIGMTTGAIYGLVALGYTLVYGILQLINFAHGDVFALSGLFASTLILSVFDLTQESAALVLVGGLVATLLITMAFGAVVNTTIERVGYRPLRQAPRLAVLITAVGMSFIVQNISLAIYGVNYHRVPPLIPRSDAFSIGGSPSSGTNSG